MKSEEKNIYVKYEKTKEMRSECQWKKQRVRKMQSEGREPKVGSKSGLAVILSQFEGFESPKRGLEQYETESEIAAEVLWNAFFSREIEGKVIADLGAGTGILGIGALLLGAKKVFLVEKDGDALNICKDNLNFIDEKFEEKFSDDVVLVKGDVSLFDERADIVIQNPPFGIRGRKHADRAFLEKAFQISNTVYSFHTIESKPLIEALSKDQGFRIGGYWEFNWPLKNTMKFHKKRIQYIKIGCWKLEKN